MTTDSTPNVRVIHETNPIKYYPAVLQLARAGVITLVGLHRYSVVKEGLRAALKSGVAFRKCAANSFDDFRLLLHLRQISGETIIIGFAPWDWRIIKFRRLVRRNRVLYHTSWPWWGLGETPRQYGPLTRLFRRQWEKFIVDPRVTVVTVLDASAHELSRRYAIRPVLIPHAVSADFFLAGESVAARKRDPGPLRLIYIGELSAAKGLPQLLRLMARLDELEVDVRLTIIGDGPMRAAVEEAAMDHRIRYVGSIWDRGLLAAELVSHDLLLLLSQRTRTWEELFGIVITEAMASGVGVLASDHVGPHALLGDAELDNLFADDELEAVAMRIADLNAHPAELQAFKAAHRVLAERFHIDRVSQAWRRLIVGEDSNCYDY